jgi:phosphoribosylformylglycinamidine synthase
VPEVIALRGRSARSSFRIAKLLGSLSAIRPDHAITALSARYWHFVEVERPLDAREHATLTRLLTYGPLDASDASADA